MGVCRVPCLGCPVVIQRSLASHGSPTARSPQSTPSSLNHCVCSTATVSKQPCPKAACLVKKLQSSRHGSKRGFVSTAITSVASEVETPGTLLRFQLMQIEDTCNIEQVEKKSIASQTLDLLSTPAKEILRRQRIAQANKGRVPWNKGRHHSTETIARIREKTREAMNKPQVREKLRQNGRAQSSESKEKIRCTLKNIWNRKQMKMVLEKISIREWREAVAEAARVGGVDDDELEWDTYKKLKHQMRLQQIAAAKQDRIRLKQEMRALNKAMRGPGHTMEHRMKISEAIRAKWEDPEYRRKTLASIRKRTGYRTAAMVKSTPHKEHGDRPTVDESFIAEVLAEEHVQNLQRASAAGQLKRPPHITLQAAPQSKTTFSSAGEVVFMRRAEASHTDPNYQKVRVAEVASNSLRSCTSQESDNPSIDSPPVSASYIDPLASQKLEKIKQLRESRLRMELQRREATDRARLLMVEAQRAALALESAAQTDKTALATLNKTRHLLAEAARTMQMVESEKNNHSLSPELTSLGYVNDMLMRRSFSSPSASTPAPKQQSITGTEDSLAGNQVVDDASRVHHFGSDNTQSHQLQTGMMPASATRESPDVELASLMDNSSLSRLLAREMRLVSGQQEQQEQQKTTQIATALGSSRIKVKKWYKDDDTLMADSKR